jgi:YbbR domain-containing protein
MTAPSLWQRWLRLLAQLRHYRVENLGIKLLALFIAFMLFVVSRQPVSDVRLVGVPLEFRGLDPNLEISGDIAQTVSVRLRGPRDLVRNILPNQVAVAADLSHKEPGERVVLLNPEDVSRPSSIEVLRIEPASIKLRIEPTASRRVPVEPQFMGDVVDGFELYGFTAEPPLVDILGPQSHIAQIDRALTESIRLDGRQASFTAMVDVDIPDNAIRVATPGPVKIAVEIAERRLERRLTGVPVVWPDHPRGARLLTPTVDVTLYGPRSAVEALQVSDLRVEISTADLPVAAQTAKPQVRLLRPNVRIEIRSVTPAEVRLKR